MILVLIVLPDCLVCRPARGVGLQDLSQILSQLQRIECIDIGPERRQRVLRYLLLPTLAREQEGTGYGDG